MINFLRKKSNLVLALALLAAPTFSACSTDDGSATAGEPGSLGLRLKVGDRNIDVVHYEISRPGSASIVGDLNVSSAKVLSFRIGGLPAGNGYTILLTATTRDGEQTCSGSANFDVVAGRVTSVAITLSCSDATGTLGSIDVNGGFNQCPVITSLVAAPLEAAVGESISLNATATDEDGDELVYAWNDEDGAFANTAGAEYECDSEGEHSLVVSVNDGNCVATDTVTVVCTPGEDTGTDETETTTTTTTTTTTDETETTTTTDETETTTTTDETETTTTTTTTTTTDETETTTTTTTTTDETETTVTETEETTATETATETETTTAG